MADGDGGVLGHEHHRGRLADDEGTADDDGVLALAVNAVVVQNFHARLRGAGGEPQLLAGEGAGVGEVGHAVDVLAGGQMVADLVLIGLQMLRQGPEHEAAVDGIVGVDRFNLRDERFLRHVLRQDELLHLHADELCAGGRALFIGQVGGVLAAADDGKLRADALFLQSRDTRLQLFVHRSGNFLAKQ